MHVARMHLIVLSRVSVSILSIAYSRYSTLCVIVLQVYLIYFHFGEHKTLAASLMTMAIIIGTFFFYCVRKQLETPCLHHNTHSEMKSGSDCLWTTITPL